MIGGIVTDDGVPLIVLRLADEDWTAVVDTGFNGALELPAALSLRLDVKPAGSVRSELASGVVVQEDVFRVRVSFDGDFVDADVTFAEVDHVLVGTWMLLEHRLEIDFPKGTVRLSRTAEI